MPRNIRPITFVLRLAFPFVCIVSMAQASGALAAVASVPLRAGWQSELEGRYAEGGLYRARQVLLTVWQQGFYDRTADGLELELDGVRLPMIPVQSTYDLECENYLSFADGVVSEDALPWARAGDSIRLVLRNEVFSRCEAFPVHPWTLKVQIRNASGQVVSHGEFRGQPYRIPR